MARQALSWNRAAAIAWRDLKSAPGKFGFVVFSVAVGVAALVGVRGFSQSFTSTLLTEARSLMAGDLMARIFRTPKPDELTQLDHIMQSPHGGEMTWVTETVSMGSVPKHPVPLLVSLKAVDPSVYPFYGQVLLEPQMTLQEALRGKSVVVSDEFLIRMNAAVGNTLRLGGEDFTITAVLRQEPDRMSSGAGLGPRVMVSSQSLITTGLIAPGSRASRRLLLKLPHGANVTQIRGEVEAALPDAQVTDFKEGNPALNEGLEHAIAILSLICLVAMVLGAIGVAMAMHAHLEQRMDMLAILKAIGARSDDLLRIFLLQTLGLGFAGGLLGVAAGVGVMLVLPGVFGKLIPVQTILHIPWRSMAAGLGTGLLTTLLFCLPPLLGVRAVRPVLVLRRLVEETPAGWRSWISRWWLRRMQLGISGLVIVALGGIAWALSRSALVGGWFALIFLITLIVLLLLASLLLRFVRIVLDRIRLQIPSTLRHGLANLYRPGNQSAAVMASIGTGVMLILTVYLMQSALLHDLRETASPKLPNVFLIDISTDEVPGIRAFFEHQQGVTHALGLMPVVQGRFVTLNGKTLDQSKDQHFPRRMLENAELSWADAVPEGDRVTSGSWWSRDDGSEIAISDGVAKRLHLKVGSEVELDVAGRVRSLHVAALFRADGEHLASRLSFLLPSGQIKDAMATWYGGVHMNSDAIPSMERSLFSQYPTVTVVSLADILDRIESVVKQITFVVRFLAYFSILAGLMILASSIASARFRRMREAVVLKTLGATRMRIVGTYSIEFSVLGLLAGEVGVAFANLLTRILLHRLDVKFNFDTGAAVVAIAGTMILATATGWIASFRILGLRPLEVLREE
jgi:putative ABC transport system permease protein